MNQLNRNNCLNSDIWLEKRGQEEYGCHLAQFTNNLREKKCIYCLQRKPALLEELAFSVILENEELFKRLNSAFCHLSQRICWLIGRALNANLLSQVWQLVGFVSDFGKTQESWFDVDESKTKCLTRFLLYCEVHQKLKSCMNRRSAGIDEILHYLSNVDSKYEDFWSRMTSAIRKLKAETESEDFEPLESMFCADGNNVVIMKATELAEDVLLDRDEYESLKELQRLNKTFACPIVFVPATIALANLESHEIPSLLDNFVPEVITDIDIKTTAWSITDIDELRRVLSACNNLSSIYLRQKPAFDEDLEDVSPAISRLLSHHPRLQKIGFTGFDVEGTLAGYALPAVENLRFRICTFADEDFNFLANRSDLALKSLVVSAYFYDEHFPSLSAFIENQANSLETLELGHPTVSLTEICHLLRIMAKFNKLQVFVLNCKEEISFGKMEKIIVDMMSIHSTRKFVIETPLNVNFDEIVAEVKRLIEVMKDLCKINRRPPINLRINIAT